MASSTFPVSLPSRKDTVLQPRKISYNSDLLHVLKREKHEEDLHADHVKKPRRAGKHYRKKDERSATSLNILDSSMSMAPDAGTSQLQPFKSFLTHRPSMTGFDAFSPLVHLPFSPIFHHPMLVTNNKPEQFDTRLDIGGAAFVHPTSTFRPNLPNPLLDSPIHPQPPHTTVRNDVTHHPTLRRYSLSTTQPSLPFRQTVYTTPRSPSPALKFPPVPEMPSSDVDVQARQCILEETIKMNKEILIKWEQETHQHIKSLLLDNILERNKFIRNLTDDIKGRLSPKTSIWPETQYPFCIIISEDDDDLP